MKLEKEIMSMALDIIFPYRLTGPTGSTGLIVTTNSMFANNTLGIPSL